MSLSTTIERILVVYSWKQTILCYFNHLNYYLDWKNIMYDQEKCVSFSVFFKDLSFLQSWNIAVPSYSSDQTSPTVGRKGSWTDQMLKNLNDGLLSLLSALSIRYTSRRKWACAIGNPSCHIELTSTLSILLWIFPSVQVKKLPRIVKFLQITCQTDLQYVFKFIDETGLPWTLSLSCMTSLKSPKTTQGEVSRWACLFKSSQRPLLSTILCMPYTKVQ